MESLLIESRRKDFFTPYVNFDVDTGVCELRGESYLENAFPFYDQLISWLEEYTSDLNNSIEFKIKLTYFNTASSKYIMRMLMVLKAFDEKGGDVALIWYYDPSDEDIIEEIEDMSEESGLDIITFEREGLRNENQKLMI